jgi:hypothetical protein
MRLALRTFADHPAVTAKELVRSVAATAGGPSRATIRDVVTSNGQTGLWELPVMAFAFLVVAVMWVAALAGVVRLVRQRRFGVLVALAIPPLYLIAASLGQGYSRFRVPALPFLVVLAGIGGAWLLRELIRADATPATADV